MRYLGTAALVLLVIGGLNWGLIGLTGIDGVARLFGAMSPTSRVIYVAVGLAALYCVFRLPRWSRAN